MNGKVLQMPEETKRKATEAKIKECIRTKVVYVKSINEERLQALRAKGFMVILK